MDLRKEEKLFVGTAEAEHVEMYLKAIGTLEKKEKMLRLVQLQKFSILDNQV